MFTTEIQILNPLLKASSTHGIEVSSVQGDRPTPPPLPPLSREVLGSGPAALLTLPGSSAVAREDRCIPDYFGLNSKLLVIQLDYMTVVHIPMMSISYVSQGVGVVVSGDLCMPKPHCV